MSKYRIFMFFALLASGCNDKLIPLPDDVGERYASVLCAAEAACGCQKYASVEECESDVLAAFERVTVEVSNFDEDCFERMLVNIEHRGCVYGRDFPIPAHVRATPIATGKRAYVQHNTILQNPSRRPVIHASRTVWFPAAAPTCTAPRTAGCAPRSEDGEACSDPYECNYGSFCAAETGMCTPSLGISESCNPDDWRPCYNTMVSAGQSEAMWCNPESALCELSFPLRLLGTRLPVPPVSARPQLQHHLAQLEHAHRDQADRPHEPQLRPTTARAAQTASASARGEPSRPAARASRPPPPRAPDCVRGSAIATASGCDTRTPAATHCTPPS